MMNPEIKERWVRALRSGKFPQGAGMLHRDWSKGVGGTDDKHHFCCLGVLCEIAVADGEVESVEITGRDDFSGVFTYTTTPNDMTSGNYHYLPLAVREWAGIDDNDPEVTIDGRHARLSTFNDDNVSFGTIADAIEEQL